MADVAHLVRRAAREFSGNVAIDDGSSTRTFAQLGDCAERLANALGGILPPGAAVGILSENRVEYPELDIGLLLAGRVRVGLNVRLHLEDFRHVARDCDMRVLVFSERFAAEAAALAEDAGLVTIGLDQTPAPPTTTPACSRARPPRSSSTTSGRDRGHHLHLGDDRPAEGDRAESPLGPSRSLWRC